MQRTMFELAASANALPDAWDSLDEDEKKVIKEITKRTLASISELHPKIEEMALRAFENANGNLCVVWRSILHAIIAEEDSPQ